MKHKERRPEEITEAYFKLLDLHLAELVSGKTTQMMELNEIAAKLHISAKHLSYTIQSTMGNHPCHFYDQKILAAAKNLLTITDWSVAEIADRLTYDPSNFAKFFKKYAGETPGQFRKLAQSNHSQKIAKSSP
ncbi:AraC family transcriptional regulator [Pseudoflavitalea sp. G-6-1-2]|uniref:helix-turn-helix domain-containing protein n=1 Tax=Pseudoflavitalea sp. G-6-1-2 TaxID=2728841 RepID=UPI00146CD214|nr:AraC family transcriptional regulator [Pseudoflavitalea sp. G-6-1-2]NML22919.1 AraC family transcriptional regulator [Pseudoflavitalea sp. G-6-1-2]